MRDSEGLIARINQIRRLATDRERADREAPASRRDRVEALEARVAYLEQLLEGLQDSVHRESDRHDRLIDELRRQVQPGAMGAALAEDARTRGLS